MSDSLDRMKSCLILASRATYRGEAEAALAGAHRIAAAHSLNLDFYVTFWNIDLDMDRFDRSPDASKPGDNARQYDQAGPRWAGELTPAQRRVLRTNFAHTDYVRNHVKGTRWDLWNMPADIRRALGL